MHAADDWRRIEELFYAALDLDADARPAFLDEACGSNTQLRQEVNSLLASAEKPVDFVPQAVVEIAHKMSADGGPEMDAGVCMARRRTALAPGTQLAHYKVVSKIGSGGMGEVYLAEDLSLRRKVALKMLAPELTSDEGALSRFEQEAHAASALNHPNILTIYEFGQAEGLHFIASEFVQGATLRLKLASGRLDLISAIDIAIQIASALAAAHACGIVHRDIKPENVIVRTDGIVKVLDFGIAKLSARHLEQTILRNAGPIALSTVDGMVMGTAKYMSPEQARGVLVDGRSDIFSLGSVLYELIVGKAAFEGDTASDVIAEILRADPLFPAEVAPGFKIPVEVENIINKALRKDRTTRYQSVREMLTDLQDFKKEAEFQAKLEAPVRAQPGKAGQVQKMPAPGMALASKQIPFFSSRWLWPIAVLLVILSAITYFLVRKRQDLPITKATHSLAILPFRNLNNDPKLDFLGFSLADEIITKLDYVNALTVRPSSSVDKYRNQVIDPKKVAADLNVDTLLTGSFLKVGDDLRITAQLVDVNLDKILWREAFDLKYDNLLTVQDRVTQQIIKQLEVKLSPREEANLKPEKPINANAYEDYLRGIDLYSLSEFPAAIQVLERATALQPNYAPAWAQLGRAYTTNASLEFGGQEDYEKAQAAYEKAIALDPGSAEPRIYMANLLTDTGRVEQAVPMLRAVLQSSPNNAEAHWELGYAYRFGGMLRESVAESEQARQNNPQVKVSSAAMNSYLYLGEYEKFLLSLPVSDFAYILFYRGLAEYYMNDREQAARDFDGAFEKNPSLLPTTVGKALSYSIRHDNARGLKVLRRTEQVIEERGVSDPEGIYKMAQAYAILGDKASALHMLRHSIGGGFFCYPYFVRDELLQSLHGEPEFQELMNQSLRRHEQFKASFF